MPLVRGGMCVAVYTGPGERGICFKPSVGSSVSFSFVIAPAMPRHLLPAELVFHRSTRYLLTSFGTLAACMREAQVCMVPLLSSLSPTRFRVAERLMIRFNEWESGFAIWN